jgi:hypothetical protein
LAQPFHGVSFPVQAAAAQPGGDGFLSLLGLADVNALIIRIDHNAMPEMLRADRAATAGARLWMNKGQLAVESELSIGDVDAYVTHVFGAVSDDAGISAVGP